MSGKLRSTSAFFKTPFFVRFDKYAFKKPLFAKSKAAKKGQKSFAFYAKTQW